MRNLKYYITALLVLLQSISFAQTYSFDMRESNGKDYKVNIALSNNHISVKENGAENFSCDFEEYNVNENTVEISFPIGDPKGNDDSMPFFKINDKGFKCTNADGSIKFSMTPIDIKEYKTSYLHIKKSLLAGICKVEEPDEPPAFPGGMNALMEYISNYISYPSAWEEEKIEARVVFNLNYSQT